MKRGDRMVFKKDEAGRVRYLAFSNNSYMIFIKQPWYGGQDIHLGILIFSLITFLLTPIAALIGWVISRFKKDYVRRSSRRESWARGLALVLCLAFLAFVAIFVQNMYTPDQPAICIMAWVIAALALGVTLMDIVAWRAKMVEAGGTHPLHSACIGRPDVHLVPDILELVATSVLKIKPARSKP